ncbi:MAG: phytanoyl-CoA dioxygenase family protein, partial [Alphaproteobacteria bacterium]|nr:phytanoyl-CoA dioxygenase family protein [Alphaproteobacteria bacterium]
MKPETVLSQPPRVLTQTQREHFFETGYLLLPAILPADWLARLREATGELVERSRSLTHSDAVYDLEAGHTAAAPRLRRMVNPSVHHPAIWQYVSDGIVADIAADLLGADVKFLDTQLNFKW